MTWRCLLYHEAQLWIAALFMFRLSAIYCKSFIIQIHCFKEVFWKNVDSFKKKTWLWLHFQSQSLHDCKTKSKTIWVCDLEGASNLPAQIYSCLQINQVFLLAKHSRRKILTEVLWPQWSLKIWFKHTETHSSSQNVGLNLQSKLQ